VLVELVFVHGSFLQSLGQLPIGAWVLASGAFNLKAKNNQMIVQEAIKSMWLLCNKGIVFNVLIEGSDIRNENMHFYDPGIVLNYCHLWQSSTFLLPP
jgi:hypothetical protein